MYGNKGQSEADTQHGKARAAARGTSADNKVDASSLSTQVRSAGHGKPGLDSAGATSFADHSQLTNPFKTRGHDQRIQSNVDAADRGNSSM